MAPIPVRVLLTVYFYMTVAVFFCLAFVTELIAYVILAPFSFRSKACKPRVLSSIFQTYMLLALHCLPFWRVKFLNGPPPGYFPKRTVIMSNHASGADPWLLTAVVYPWPAFFVIKDSLCRVPVAGWCLWLAGYVRVKFTKEKGGWGTAPGAVKQLMQEASEVMDRGHALVVFPEGTRSVTGRLQPFKEGFFRFATQHPEISILPVGVHGSHSLWPVTSKLVDCGTVYIKYGEPISGEGETVESLKQKTHQAVFDLLKASPKFDEHHEQPLVHMASHRGHGL